MPLISVHDAAPVLLRGRRNTPDRRAWVSAVTFVDCLNDSLLAQVAADTPEHSTELAERVAWGVWRAGMHYDGPPMIPWDASSYDPPSLWPHPTKSEHRPWSRRVVIPQAMLWVYGGPLAWQTPKYLASCADLGLTQGPARWDHRSQYLSERSLPRDVTVDDALGEIGDAPLAKRLKIRPHAILRAIAQESK